MMTDYTIYSDKNQYRYQAILGTSRTVPDRTERSFGSEGFDSERIHENHKEQSFGLLFMILVTRTGIEPMLLP